ncbi:hypothetical protein GWK26_12555 [haloarchaeon 3A1-DGR]|nr:hypothetical protein GWK26_12555 [haloarchaeon 3A1-DGR]
MTDDDSPGVASRSYSGTPLDGSYQHISERPFGGPGETIDVVDSDSPGEEKTIGEPQIGSLQEDGDGQDRDGQTTLDTFL